MTGASRVLVAVRVPCSPARAFTAFTEKISEWWQPNGLFQFSEGRTGTLTFEPGPHGRLVERYLDGDSFVIGHTQVWDPPRRLVLSWRHANFTDAEQTELHVRFEPVDATDTQTRVTVEHHGWDALPPEHAARHGFPLPTFQHRFAQWWQALLHAMAERV